MSSQDSLIPEKPETLATADVLQLLRQVGCFRFVPTRGMRVVSGNNMV